MKEAAANELLSKVGKWQIQNTLLLGFALTPLSWHYLSYPLLSKATKEFKCSSPNVTTDLQCDDNCREWAFADDGSLSLQEDFELVCQHEKLLALRQTVFFLGMLIGCLITGSISDRYGRKPTMLALMAIWSTSAFLHSVVPDYWSFLTLQFILVGVPE